MKTSLYIYTNINIYIYSLGIHILSEKVMGDTVMEVWRVQEPSEMVLGSLSLGILIMAFGSVWFKYALIFGTAETSYHSSGTRTMNDPD